MQRHGDTRIFAQMPTVALRPFVRRFLVVEFPLVKDDSHLPDTGLIAAFPFHGSCRLDDGTMVQRSALTGLHDHLRHHAHSPGNAIVLVQFTPTGASAFFRHPLDELANSTVGLDTIVSDGPSVALLEEQLAELPNHLRRVQQVETFLLARAVNTPPDPLVAAAVHWIENAPPGTCIKDLVRHIGLSQSALERRFRRLVGTTPKKFAGLVRLQRILRRSAAGDDFTTIAHATGYHDQSHFTHDFRRMTGLTPGDYFAHIAD